MTPLRDDTDPPDTINATALAYAKTWNLVCEDGTVICLRDGCGLTATLPGLLCPGHLAVVQRRGGR